MKMIVLCIVTFFTLSFSCFSQAAYDIIIHGKIQSFYTADAVKNHQIWIVSDTFQCPLHYTNSIYTDVNGYFADTITTNCFHTAFHMMTDDCNGGYIDSLLFFDTHHRDASLDFVFRCDSASETCQAYYTYTKGGCDNCIVFTNASLGNQDSLFWDFGDSTYSNMENPFHEFPDPGEYFVCLTIGALNGCESSYCEYVSVGHYSSHFYNLGGQVFAGDFPIGKAKVFLYSKNDDHYFTAGLFQVDTLGFYYFYQIPEGEYIVKAEPFFGPGPYSNYAPAYTGDKLNWSDASVIDLDTNYLNADISTIPLNLSHGNCSISGMVLQNNNGSDTIPHPAKDIEILLLDANDKAVDARYSSPSGYFAFNDIAYGTYKVYTEVTGKQTFPSIITLDNNTPDNNITIVIYPSYISQSAVDDQDNYSSHISEAYPSPSNGDNVSLDINLKAGAKFDITLYNTIGQNVYSESKTLSAGNNNISISTGNLPRGLYSIQLKVCLPDRQAETEIIGCRKFVKIN